MHSPDSDVLYGVQYNCTQKLVLNYNQIGDTGMQAFAAALAGGAMAQCTYLLLSNNKIGDAGMQALSTALAGGAMARLQASSPPPLPYRLALKLAM